MKPAATDPFPRRIELRPGRRRTVELTLEDGRFVARIPATARGPRLEGVLASLRAELWEKLQRSSVYTDDALAELAGRVAREHLSDLDLPPWTVRFSRRQHRRWGSCTVENGRGRIRISAHLVGHPRWVIAQILLHELIHLVVPDHGPRFRELERRSPDHDRGRGYIEALETVERVGAGPVARAILAEDGTDAQVELFARPAGD